MGHRRSGIAAGGLLTTAAVGIGVAVSLGAGYTVAHATLSDSSAFVSKGTTVEHVNGEARRVDATTNPPIAKRGEQLKTITLPGGRAVAVNQNTGVVTTIDGATMSPSATVRPSGSGSSSSVSGRPGKRVPMDVVVAGTQAWIVDHDGSRVRRLIDGNPHAPISLPGKPVDAAPGPAGSLIVLTDDTKLLRVTTDGTVHRIDAAAPDLQAGALTVAGDHPYLVNGAGAVFQVDTDTPQKIGHIAGLGPDGTTGRMLVGSLQGLNEHVLVVSGDLLGVVDPQTGRAISYPLHAQGSALGRPVEYRGHVYVPDLSRHRVLVVNLTDGSLGKPLTVPGDRDGSFELFVAGGRLWANDQYAQHMLELDQGGRHTVDKGTGDGTRDDTKKPRKPKAGQGAPPPSTTLPGTGGSGGSQGNGGGTGKGHRHHGGGHGGGHQPPPPPQKPEQVVVPRFGPHTNYHDLCDRIEQLGPNCNAVSAGEDHAGNAEDVLSTTPSAGQKVERDGSVQVTFIGPSEVPNIAPGGTPKAACAQIETAGLTCRPTPSPRPARDPAQYGTVVSLNPASSTPLDKGKPVQVVYYDSFTMPDLTGQAGDKACAAVQQSSLQLPTSSVDVKCTAAAGKAPTSDKADQVNKVYAQNARAGATYQPGGSAIALTYYKGDAKLRDYTGQEAQTSVTDCQHHFDCSISPNTVVPADANGPHPEWAGKVVAMQDGNNQPRPAGRYPVGSATKVVLVQYGSATAAMPDTSNQPPAQACAMAHAAGYNCTAATGDAPWRNGAVIYAQSIPAGQIQPIGTAVTVTYNPRPLVIIQEYVSNSVHLSKENRDAPSNSDGMRIHIMRPYGTPPPAGYTLEGNVGVAYQSGTYNVNWHLKEFRGDCDDIQGNILYSHGAPEHCMVDASKGNGFDNYSPADVVPDNGGQCPAGTVWLWRVQNGGYNVFKGTASDADVPTQFSGYHEPMGCIWAS